LPQTFELGKKLDASPLINIEKRIVEMQNKNLLGKHIFSRIAKKETPRDMIVSFLNIKLTKEYLNSHKL